MEEKEKVPDWTKPMDERNPKISMEIIFEGHPIKIHRIIQMIRHLDYSSLKKVTIKRPKKIK